VSGIPNYVDLPAFNAMILSEGGKMTLRERGDFTRVLALVRGKPLDFAPGTKWAYSNTNYALLGRIVEIASSTPWQAYIQAHVFAPAGMTESAFMDDEVRLQDVATGYAPEKDKLLVAGTFNGWAGAAGAIVSTASDMAKWDAALFGGKIVAPDDLALMTRPGALPALSAKSRYGFGWVVDTFDEQQRLWHNGGTLGFSASNHIYPGLSEAIIVLENNSGSDSDAIADAVFNTLHPALAAAAAAKVAAGEDAAVTARAKRIWDELMAGKVDRNEFTASLVAALTPAALEQGTAKLRSLGPPTSWTFAGSDVRGTMTSYSYRLGFASAVSLTLVMSVDAGGKISGFFAR
jgi:CubicO group peptidase (beta-lactamase class C family)